MATKSFSAVIAGTGDATGAQRKTVGYFFTSYVLAPVPEYGMGTSRLYANLAGSRKFSAAIVAESDTSQVKFLCTETPDPIITEDSDNLITQAGYLSQFDRPFSATTQFLATETPDPLITESDDNIVVAIAIDGDSLVTSPGFEYANAQFAATIAATSAVGGPLALVQGHTATLAGVSDNIATHYVFNTEAFSSKGPGCVTATSGLVSFLNVDVPVPPFTFGRGTIPVYPGRHMRS